MKNSKLISLIRTFNQEEFKEFGYFVNSPFFVKNKKLPKLYQEISRFYPNFDNPNFTRERIFNKLYPNKKYNEKLIKYQKTELYKAAETYLGILDCKNQKLDFMWHTLVQYSRRKLHVEFAKKTSELKEFLDKSEEKDNEFYFRNYLLIKEIRNFYEVTLPLGKRAAYFESVKDELDVFIVYGIIKLLKYYAVLSNQKSLLNFSFDSKLQDDLMNFAKENINENHPTVKVLYTLNMLHKNTEDENIYYQLKELAKKYYRVLDEKDKELVYAELYNYSKLKYIDGKEYFRKENAEIMKLMLSKKIYPKEDNYMSINTFINIVSDGLKDKEFKWVEEFIRKYKTQIEPGRRENVNNYCLGLIHYKKREFDKAVTFLSKVKTDDFYFYLSVKNQLLKIFCEKNETELVLNTIDAFKHYLASKDMIPDYLNERFSIFIHYLEKFVKITGWNDNKKLIKLEIEIKESPKFENKIWLLNKIKEKLAA